MTRRTRYLMLAAIAVAVPAVMAVSVTLAGQRLGDWCAMTALGGAALLLPPAQALLLPRRTRGAR